MALHSALLAAPALRHVASTVAALSPQWDPPASHSQALNVVHVVSGNSLAGVERHVLLLARSQMAHGMGVHVAFRRGGWFAQALRESGIPHTPLPMRGTLDPITLAQLVRLAFRERADVVHGHLSRGMVYALATARLTGLPSVGTDHMGAAHWTMPYLDRLIVPTAGFLRQAPYPLAESQVAMAPNGVDLEALQEDAWRAAEERRSWNIPAEALVVGVLGRLSPVKGHDLLLRAVATMSDRERPYLVFAGPEEAEWGRRLRQLATTLGLDAATRFLGPRQNVGAVLAAFDVVAMPSLMEMCPLALLEAMSLGCPVVACEVGGIPDIVDDGRTGLLTPSQDPAALADALHLLLSNRPLRLRLGAAASKEAANRFTAKAMAHAIERIYREAIGIADEAEEPAHA
ncbi:MAG TPA: glycosyltransferase family 4 protein [Armatimonadota bacterium]|jgi:glycosyltransferase involved in cell wall biosynthesis